jgi:hypothetical protein
LPSWLPNQLTAPDETVFGYNLETSEKPWRKPGLARSLSLLFTISLCSSVSLLLLFSRSQTGADLTDYFNYGFTEDTWRAYIAKQANVRSDVSQMNPLQGKTDNSSSSSSSLSSQFQQVLLCSQLSSRSPPSLLHFFFISLHLCLVSLFLFCLFLYFHSDGEP